MMVLVVVDSDSASAAVPDAWQHVDVWCSSFLSEFFGLLCLVCFTTDVWCSCFLADFPAGVAVLPGVLQHGRLVLFLSC